MTRILALLALMMAAPAVAFAAGPLAVAPEIDATTALTALALIGGAAAVIRGRRRL